MAEQVRSVLRGIARLLMRDLERDSLGIYAEGRLRDTFRLDPDLPATHLLTTRPNQRNFIRSEDGGLLFRDASSNLADALGERVMMLRKAESRKGLEFLWSRLDEDTLRHLFTVVVALALYPDRLALPEASVSSGHVPNVERRPHSEPGAQSRHERATLKFQLAPGDILQTDRLIYAWEIRDTSGRLRYRYIGKSEPGAERPLKRYGINVANLLAGRPYSRAKPDGFRLVHKRLADASEWQWPITLCLVTNVGSSENIYEVESSYDRELAYDDWPLHGRR